MCPQKTKKQWLHIPLRFIRIDSIHRMVCRDQVCYQISWNHAVMFIGYRITYSTMHNYNELAFT